MRKPDFCLCENKDADHLCSNCTADQGLCLSHSDRAIPLLLKSKFPGLPFFCDCTARFVSDLVGNPEDWFSRVVAKIVPKSIMLHCRLLQNGPGFQYLHSILLHVMMLHQSLL